LHAWGGYQNAISTWKSANNHYFPRFCSPYRVIFTLKKEEGFFGEKKEELTLNDRLNQVGAEGGRPISTTQGDFTSSER